MPHDPQPRPACEDGSGALTALDGSPPSSYKSRRISRNVYFLGLLSLFNDVTADMITPLLPVYLATMGLGASFLGAMEGLANSVSNMTMLFSGWYADRKGNSRALTVGGYRLSTLTRLFYFFPFPNVTLAARLLNRVGK